MSTRPQAYLRAARECGECFTEGGVRKRVADFSEGGFRSWMRRLLREKSAIIVGGDPPKSPRLYKLIADPLEPIKGRAQRHMWTAIRQLTTFSVDDLLFIASTDDLELKRNTVVAYVSMLERAGALLVVQKASGPGAPGLWRLRPSLNTGPTPPLRRGDDVIDGNLGHRIGSARS